ncbi:hypothetical protein HF086_013077 [Spodoptera exigua]|uniref:Uncharacterized protein n=1 Tax=Spodoptera exigua TaxID=7107 RepID=A0A922MXD4_SPOEX|nr:hypothetical protein HF086_013077 [Spodoptera exigua]
MNELTYQFISPQPAAILDEEYAEKQMNKMEKQTAKLEGAIKTEGEQTGPKIEMEFFQFGLPHEVRFENYSCSSVSTDKKKGKGKKRKHEDDDDDSDDGKRKKKKPNKHKPKDTPEERVNREMEKVALLQSRMEKRKKKQRRIRAVDDDDDRPQHAPRKSNKMKKKQSNFANDLTDTSRAATKRLRYDANKAQKGNKGPKKGKGPAKGKPNAKPKAFGKPQAGKGRRKNK